MKTLIKRTATATALLLLCTGLSLAQAPGGKGGPPADPEQMADRQIAGMKERLNLTADQEKKIRPILLESAKQNAEMRKKFTAGERPSEDAMAEMRKSREASNKKVAEILNDDQKKEYEKMLSERRGMGPGGQGGGRKKGAQQ